MRRNPLAVAALVVLGLLAFTFFVVRPKGDEARAMRQEIETAETELTALRADVAALAAAADNGAATQDLAAIRRTIPSQPDLPVLLRGFREIAASSGVTMSSVSPGVPIASPTGSASVIALTITVSGSYFDLARFIHELETQERLTKVTAFSISGSETGSDLVMQLSAEVYTTDLSTGPGSDPAPGAEVGA